MNDQIQAVLAASHACLGHNLIGAYLFGSAVSGGLRKLSDLDVLLVTSEPLDALARQALLAAVLPHSAWPPRGELRPLELIVFSRAGLAGLPQAPSAEFLFGEWLRADFCAGTPPGPVTRPDFVLVLAQARSCAEPLFGPPAEALLPEIDFAAVARAIGAALPDLLTDLTGDERNVLLTLARMIVTLETGTFVAKDAAALTIAPRLSQDQARLIELAANAYRGETEDDWTGLAVETAALAAALAGRIAALSAQGSVGHATSS